jgi:putative SOS response-associated peptidase YedK
MYWGLIPYWAEDPKKLGVSTINAKAESLMRSGCGGSRLMRRRCLVPADGFYEWQKFDAKVKQPWAIALKGDEPLAFAGLWDRWRSADKKTELESFSIITTEANEVTSPMHERMPVILMTRDYARWLQRDDAGTAAGGFAAAV